MPAHERLARQRVYRQGRGVHEPLVTAGQPEGREVPLQPTLVVHRGVGIARAVRVVVDELAGAHVTEQARLPGVLKMTREEPRTVTRVQKPGPGERESSQQGRAAYH